MKKDQLVTKGGMKVTEVKPKKGRVYLPDEEIKVEGFPDKNVKDTAQAKDIIVEDSAPDRKKSRIVAKEVKPREAGEKNNWVSKLMRNKKGNEKGKGKEM